ncbi:inner membrane protein YiaA [Parendozoicomonas haliclonae]|uniref:Inner membrane protein YiaA n=1 Tax=Parendozoicomonas haliclonae TaxID=1960125 RepID=A0A1X7AI86_9GAMM|nr:inner membrane protein YiaA [Parendozoicomonas haliclonae]SMA43136.1 Inner membrane protein YiaA [Parendozoicomonas haliclonae]
MMNKNSNKPTAAYIAASWGALAIGALGYLIGLWNAQIEFNEKGYYLTVFLFAAFSAVTLQKTVRDRDEGIPVTTLFLGMCWAALSISVALLVIGLFNANMLLSEKGFYGMSFILCLFAVITVQKNTRDYTNEYGETDSAAFPTIEEKADKVLDVADIL